MTRSRSWRDSLICRSDRRYSRSAGAVSVSNQFTGLEALEPRWLLSATHLYTFNNGLGTDSIGRINLDLVNGVTVSAGKAILNNTGITSGDSANIQYLDLPAAAIPNTGPLTLEVWFSTNDTTNWTRILDFGDQSGAYGNSYLFYTPQSSNGDARLVLRPDAGTEVVASSATTNDGRQHMLAAVVDPSADTMLVYIDGNEVATAALNGTGIEDINQVYAYFGRSLYDQDAGFTGAFDQITIYDEARTASAIATTYADCPTPAPDAYPENPTQYARQVENLDRGLVALRTSSTQVYMSWRLLGLDPSDIAFNVYRSTSGSIAVKLNSSPINQTTDFIDSNANQSQTHTYLIRPVIDGVEGDPSKSFIVEANSGTKPYLSVPIEPPPSGVTDDSEAYDYVANDSSVGDLDGDGDYEIIVKWQPTNEKHAGVSGQTGNTIFDAYTLEGVRLWRIDLGINIRSGPQYNPFLVYDFDGDGRAELVTRTAPGTVDGLGNDVVINGDDPDADWRNEWGHINDGPEYLTVFDGLTGENLATVNLEPARGELYSWGDTYGNRANQFLLAAAYLDGQRPSIVVARDYNNPQSGLPGRDELAAFNWRDGELTLEWHFKAGINWYNNENTEYVGEGNHQLSVADVDGDGYDEIIRGASIIDQDGTGYLSTGAGHGDAMHVGDLDPSNPGIEVFSVHQHPSQYSNVQGVNVGGFLYDAADGSVIVGIDGHDADVGRGVAMDIDPNYAGAEMWTSADDGIWNIDGTRIYGKPSNMFQNFGVWWDGDLLRELMDRTYISKWHYEWSSPGRQNIVQAWEYGASTNNGSKETPCLSGDILGDWREEVIWRNVDSTELQIWTTTIPAQNRLFTLMHDTQYREAIAWQNNIYNQPPTTSFFLGAGMQTPEQPMVYYVGEVEGGLAGDLDYDGFVGLSDLDLILNNWNNYVRDNHIADTNGDNFIGLADLDTVLNDWNKGTPPAAEAEVLTQHLQTQEIIAAAASTSQQTATVQQKPTLRQRNTAKLQSTLTQDFQAAFAQMSFSQSHRVTHIAANLSYTPLALESSNSTDALGLWE